MTDTPAPLGLPEVSRRAAAVLDEVGRAVVGKREALELVLAGILAGGHVLIEDLPGLGKTLAARSFAQTLGLDFTRAQFTPDLLPADLTGSFIYDQKEGDFSFRAGPLFTGLLLADEINRTPPKTQAALLEAMQERQVTVEGQTFVLDPPFHVIATANPVEYEGTYPLPEAQLDRFLLRVTFGYPTSDQEWGVLERRLARQREEQVLDFTRAQFTPDLLPADLTGSFIYDQKEGDFSFRAGPLFTGLLLADEINRTPPKTQAALLEAMQERQVTVEGQTFVLDPPFHVIATANPVEYEGTYPLPEAQLDRFLLRVTFGYPTSDQEWGVLERRLARQREEQVLDAVTHGEGLRAMQSAVETVTVEESVGRYCVALAAATRDHPQVLMGASPRGALALMLTGRAYAVIRGRDYVVPEDVKAVAASVLAHRVTIRPELWMSDVTGATVVRSVLNQVPTPGARLGG